MVPDCQRRLERAIADLKAAIVCTHNSLVKFFDYFLTDTLMPHRKTVANLRTLRYTRLLLNNWKQYLPHRRSEQ
jgi:hypothetical protein